MDLNTADTLYLAMAVKHMLGHEQKNSDRIMFERLYYKLSISHNGKKIRDTFGGIGNGNINSDTK